MYLSFPIRYSIPAIFVQPPKGKHGPTYILTGSEDGKIVFYDLQSRNIAFTLHGHKGGFFFLFPLFRASRPACICELTSITWLSLLNHTEVPVLCLAVSYPMRRPPGKFTWWLRLLIFYFLGIARTTFRYASDVCARARCQGNDIATQMYQLGSWDLTRTFLFIFYFSDTLWRFGWVEIGSKKNNDQIYKARGYALLRCSHAK